MDYSQGQVKSFSVNGRQVFISVLPVELEWNRCVVARGGWLFLFYRPVRQQTATHRKELSNLHRRVLTKPSRGHNAVSPASKSFATRLKKKKYIIKYSELFTVFGLPILFLNAFLLKKSQINDIVIKTHLIGHLFIAANQNQ